jgi:hypothetical protein
VKSLSFKIELIPIIDNDKNSVLDELTSQKSFKEKELINKH